MNKERCEKEIRKFMNDTIDKFNEEYNENISHIDFPIVFNRRHNNRGYYRFRKIEYTPIEFGFSLYMLEDENKENVKQTVLHELAHYITSEIHQDNCNHDSRWEETCRKLKMKEISAKHRMTLDETLKSYRYHVYCTCNLEKPVALYHQMRKDTLEKFKRNAYRCSKCGNSNLIVLDTRTGEILAGEPVEGA